jgi:hypothetical protein
MRNFGTYGLMKPPNGRWIQLNDLAERFCRVAKGHLSVAYAQGKLMRCCRDLGQSPGFLHFCTCMYVTLRYRMMGSTVKSTDMRFASFVLVNK